MFYQKINFFTNSENEVAKVARDYKRRRQNKK